jgi:DNA-binding NtrC family response regulator
VGVTTGRVLLVDDEPQLRSALRRALELRRHTVEEASTCRAAEETVRRVQCDVAILDYELPDGDALKLLPRLRAADPDLPAVILTGHASIDLAVRALQEGADHFLTKPVELSTLGVVVERLLEQRRTRRRLRAHDERRARLEVDPFACTSSAVRRLAEQASRVAASDSAVLVQGETGTGKGVLSRWLHDHGPRASEPFVAINCAGLARELIESELFGHVKGAFTGAVVPKTGLLEVANRGTVFLDEIGDIDLAVQPKLLKALEEKQIRRVGDVTDRSVDIRLIAATHQDLAALVREKRFRSDLYFRISTIPLTVPPLRERVEDIPVLARHMLDRLSIDLGRPPVELTPEALRSLQGYHWPGNIRELRNVLERGLLLSEGALLAPADLHFELALAGPPDVGEDLPTLKELERRHIERVLRLEGGRVADAAKRLGIPRSSLYQKIKEYRIAPSKV